MDQKTGVINNDKLELDEIAKLIKDCRDDLANAKKS